MYEWDEAISRRVLYYKEKIQLRGLKTKIHPEEPPHTEMKEHKLMGCSKPVFPNESLQMIWFR